jgi:hypothetical protein
MAFPQRRIDEEYGHHVDDEDIIEQLKSEKVYNRFKFDIGILLGGEKNIINTFKLVVKNAQPKERKSIAKLLNANKGKFRVDEYGRPDIYNFENAQDYQINEILETNAYNEPIKNIEQFLRCYYRLPVAQTLEELGYGPSFISSSPDAVKEKILADQTPENTKKGGRRRKTKKSKRRARSTRSARKTRRRHK